MKMGRKCTRKYRVSHTTEYQRYRSQKWLSDGDRIQKLKCQDFTKRDNTPDILKFSVRNVKRKKSDRADKIYFIKTIIC